MFRKLGLPGQTKTLLPFLKIDSVQVDQRSGLARVRTVVVLSGDGL
jgi:hypothetical protein